MCGVVGLIAFTETPKQEEAIRQEAMIFLLTEILQQTITRGSDATGVASLFRDGQYFGQKMGISAIEFIARFGGKNEDYEGFLRSWRKHGAPATCSIGHCRKSSVGNSTNNANNHPIKVGEVLGIHNGTLTNHNTIFKNFGCKRDGTVDSEAIFRLLHFFSQNGTNPFTLDMVQEVTARLEGSYSVLAFSGNNPFQVVAFRDSRPMEFALIKPLKLVVVASEKDFIKKSLFKMNKETLLYGNKSNFPRLNAKSIDFFSLPDDSIAIFNLTKKVGEDTQIEELYDFERIKKTNKIWRAGYNSYPAKTVNEVNPTAHQTTPQTNNLPTPVQAKAVFILENTQPAGIGRIYNKVLKKYVAASPAVDITTPIRNVKVSASEDKSKPEIIEIEAIDVDESVDINTTANEEALNTVEVVMDVDPEAIEAANLAVKSLKKYENEEELLNDLEMTKDQVIVLKDLPIHSLANKVRKAAFKVGVHEGYVLGKNKSDPDSTNKKLENEKYIRILKTISGIMAMLIESTNVSAIDSSTMERVVTKAFSDGEEISSDAIGSLFSIGDMRKHVVFRQIRDMVQCKEHRR